MVAQIRIQTFHFRTGYFIQATANHSSGWYINQWEAENNQISCWHCQYVVDLTNQLNQQ